MTLTLTVPNLLATESWPTALQFRFEGFQYFFIFLAAATLAYSWRTVQGIGARVAIILLVGVGGVYLLGTTYPELTVKMSGALVGYERVLEVLDPNSVRFANRVQEVTMPSSPSSSANPGGRADC